MIGTDSDIRLPLQSESMFKVIKSTTFQPDSAGGLNHKTNSD